MVREAAETALDTGGSLVILQCCGPSLGLYRPSGDVPWFTFTMFWLSDQP